MNQAAHRVRRQRWEVSAPDRDTAFALRMQLRRDVDVLLLPALEQAFDAAGVGEEVIRIPRLAVRLYVRNIAGLATALADELPALLAEQIDAALAAMPRSDANKRRRAVIAQRQASFVQYLHSGQLDWPDMQGEPAAQAAALREEAVAVARDWHAAPAALRSALPGSHEVLVAFLFRLLQLLPDASRADWLHAMLAAIPAPATPAQQVLLQGLSNLPRNVALPVHSLLHVQAITLAVALTEGGPTVRTCLSMLATLPGVNAIGSDLLLESLQGAEAPSRRWTGSDNSPQKMTWANGEAQSKAVLRTAHIASGRESPAQLTGDMPTGLPAMDVRHVAASPPAFPLITPAPADDSAVLRVQAAGLVLAHPFLPSLFAARGLLGEDGKTLPAHQRPRAAALLHWLACGREEVFEFELGFIKPLLGLRPADPLPLAQGLLDDADREECTALLAAMISHWPALRSTSVEGLRVSFLQRQGLLHESSNNIQPGWQLQLEPESFDMLLAQLPWSISIVRLPWMTRPIFTDWPTR